MPAGFLFSYKILALKALIGWLACWAAPPWGYGPSDTQVGLEIATGNCGLGVHVKIPVYHPMNRAGGLYTIDAQVLASPSKGEACLAPTTDPQPAQQASRAETRQADTGGQRVALTLDLGPWADAEITGDILDVLEKEGVTATLFFSGRFAERHPEVVAKAVASGHQLANHTYSHPDLTKTSPEAIVEELEKTQSLLEKAAGHAISPRYFRPPYGASDRKVLAAAQSAGFRSVLWTVEALDWQKGASVEKVVERVLKKVESGGIILMHITKVTQQALPLILEKLPAQGYEFVTVEEILGEEAGQA